MLSKNRCEADLPRASSAFADGQPALALRRYKACLAGFCAQPSTAIEDARQALITRQFA